MSIFVDAKENDKVSDLKNMISGITGKPADQMKLYDLTKESQKTELDDGKTLSDSGLTATVAKAQQPAKLGVVYQKENGDFEEVAVESYSEPPELPDVMKQTNENKGE